MILFCKWNILKAICSAIRAVLSVNYIIIVSKLIKTIHNMNLKSDSKILIYLNTKYYKYN